MKVRDPEVHLEVHEGRFINLQRLTLKPSRAGAAEARVAKAAMDKGEEPPFTKVEFVASKVKCTPHLGWLTIVLVPSGRTLLVLPKEVLVVVLSASRCNISAIMKASQ